MDPILEFLNQPIILTLVTLTVGSYLLNLVADRRSRRNLREDKAIEFLNEAGNTFNQAVVQIFRKLRNNTIAVDEHVEQTMTLLYSERMGIEVGSRAYLGSEVFFKDYFKLMDDYTFVFVMMKQVDEQGAKPEEVVPRIQEYRRKLLASWPLAGETTEPDGDTVIAELILLMELILHRMTDLLTRHLKLVMD